MTKISWAMVGIVTLAQVAHASYSLDDKRAWESISSPSRMSSSFNRTFTALPLSGSVDPNSGKSWSSDYWARNKGGINYRWNSAHPTGFNLKSPTKDQAMAMTQSELAALAPSEKWDLYNGRYDYPLKKEIAAYASPSRPSWEGICDGWAASALNQEEPKPIVGTNPDGIQVPFGSADLKGILAWYYARKWSGGYGMMGRRCNGGLNIGTDRCSNDMNAGAFHIVVANRIGLSGVSYIADIDKGAQVWNHLGYSYKTTIVGGDLSPRSSSASGTVKVKRVRTSVQYVYLTANRNDPVLGTSGQKFTTRNYEYYLDINSSGNIIGGDWISSQRPDFLWLETHATFSGYYSKLPGLLPDGLTEGGAETNEGVDSQVIDQML